MRPPPRDLRPAGEIRAETARVNSFWKSFFHGVMALNCGGVLYGLSWIEKQSSHPLHLILFEPVDTISRLDPKGDYSGTLLLFILALIVVAAFTAVSVTHHYSSHVKKKKAARAERWLDRSCWMVFSWSIVASTVAVSLPSSMVRFILQSAPPLACSFIFGLLMAGVIILAYTSEGFIVMSVFILNKTFNTLDRREESNLTIGQKAFLSFAIPVGLAGMLLLFFSSFSGVSVIVTVLLDPSLFHHMLGLLIKLHLLIIGPFLPLAWLSNHDHKALLKFIFLNLIFVPIPGREAIRLGGGSSGGAGAGAAF